jgi:hypothetical protein
MYCVSEGLRLGPGLNQRCDDASCARIEQAADQACVDGSYPDPWLGTPNLDAGCKRYNIIK